MPVIGSALDLITQQLEALNIDVTALDLPKSDAVPPMSAYGIPDQGPADVSSNVPLAPETSYTPELFHFPFGDPVNPDDFNIDPDAFQSIFETISSIEPLSVRVGAIETSGMDRPQ